MHVLTGGPCGAAYSVMDFACTGLAAHLKNKLKKKITSSEVPFHSLVNTYLTSFCSLSSELPLSCF